MARCEKCVKRHNKEGVTTATFTAATTTAATTTTTSTPTTINSTTSITHTITSTNTTTTSYVLNVYSNYTCTPSSVGGKHNIVSLGLFSTTGC